MNVIVLRLLLLRWLGGYGVFVMFNNYGWLLMRMWCRCWLFCGEVFLNFFGIGEWIGGFCCCVLLMGYCCVLLFVNICYWLCCWWSSRFLFGWLVSCLLFFMMCRCLLEVVVCLLVLIRGRWVLRLFVIWLCCSVGVN